MAPGSRILLLLILTTPVAVAAAEVSGQKALHLFGGETGGAHATVYLGCLNCPSSNAASIWNKRGKFGRVSSDKSIWNRKGIYGSISSNFSPWNKSAEYPPIILDSEGGIHGRFTLNRQTEPTNIQWAAWILSNYESIRLDLDAYRRMLAEDLGND